MPFRRQQNATQSVGIRPPTIRHSSQDWNTTANGTGLPQCVVDADVTMFYMLFDTVINGMVTQFFGGVGIFSSVYSAFQLSNSRSEKVQSS